MKKKTAAREFYPAALTIAGSDSGGGAGIQADLRTFNAFGVFGCSAITAVTSQNPLRVDRIGAIDPAGVIAQIDAVCSAIPLVWAKSGMLFNTGIVEAVAEAVKRRGLKLICDPVMVSTSGAPLLEKSAAETVRDKLIPAAAWITPNLPEAELLLGAGIPDEPAMIRAAREFHDRWGVSVLLKAGHRAGNGDEIADIICRSGEVFRLISPRLELTGHCGHGTGCTLSSALTAGFALSFSWKQALCEAKSFVYGSLSERVELGDGIEAMYPPTEDTIKLIRLEAVSR